MGRTVTYAWFGALAFAGCGFDVTVGAKTDGGPTIDDGRMPDDTEPGDDALTPADATVTTLIDRGLVARYFIDEAATGQPVAALADSAPLPLSLMITHGQTAFVEEGGNRGLRWSGASTSGKIEIALGNTKLRTRLTTTPTITIEVVVQITSTGITGSESQITGMRGSNPDFMLTALDTTTLRFFRPFGTEGATWTNANTQQRMVLHLVYDTTRQNAVERIELFRNGTNIPKTTGSAPPMNQQVGLGTSDDFMIGNRQSSDRSIGGTIYYVAYYDEALDAMEIGNNAQRLLANDDL